MKNKKQILKEKILYRAELYQNNNGRLGRLIKTPLRTIIFYFMVFFAYIKPYRVYSKTLWGQKITYYLPEANHIHYYGFFEANLTNFLINFLKPGNIFLDIGAHIGYYSMLASHLLGVQGKVYSLEPTPLTFQSLKINSELAINQNIFAYNIAALDVKTKIDFLDYGPKYSAFNTFKNRQGNAYKFLHKGEKHISIPTIDLDNFCKENLCKPDFIKIDAEGAEYLILKGAENVLKNLRPLLSIEVSLDEEWKINRINTLKILSDAEYKIFEITLEGNLISTSGNATKYDNFICVPKEKIVDIQNLILNK